VKGFENKKREEVSLFSPHHFPLIRRFAPPSPTRGEGKLSVILKFSPTEGIPNFYNVFSDSLKVFSNNFPIMNFS